MSGTFLSSFELLPLPQVQSQSKVHVTGVWTQTELYVFTNKGIHQQQLRQGVLHVYSTNGNKGHIYYCLTICVLCSSQQEYTFKQCGAAHNEILDKIWCGRSAPSPLILSINYSTHTLIVDSMQKFTFLHNDTGL